MKWRSIAFGLLLLTFGLPTVSQELTPLGQWTDHLPYRPAIRVSMLKSEIIAATPYAIFSVSPNDQEINRWSSVNGLAETSIADIGTSDDVVIVVYTSGNIDILENKKASNIDDIKKAALNKNVVIHDVYVSGGSAYISTSYGISVLNIGQKEISGTYVLGTTGEEINVYQSVVFNDTIYAASEEGIKRAPLSGSNLQDYRSWSTEIQFQNKKLRYILSDGTNLIVANQDSIFLKKSDSWNFIYASERLTGEPLLSGNSIVIPEIINNEAGLLFLGLDGTVQSNLKDAAFLQYPKQLLIKNEVLWIADSLAGLSYYTDGAFHPVVPASPDNISTGEIEYFDRKILSATSSIGPEALPADKPGSIQVFEERQWKNISAASHGLLSGVQDIITLEPDKQTGDLWLGSFGDGLLNLNSNNELTQYKNSSFISPSVFNTSSYRVAGLAFDANQNLWISNYGAAQNLVVRKPDGNIEKFSPPFPLVENALSEIIIDDANQKWIISPKDNGLIVFNHGLSFENTADDQWKLLRSGTGTGNLPSNRILSLAKDKNGFLWVGTNNGIGIIYCPERVFSNEGCEAVLPVLQQGNFAGYLFRGESVQTITVDGANRKWIGTKNGAWLISADGEKTIQRFTVDNSPLPDNDIQRIGIDQFTGEVYFATAKGTVSYRSTATEITNEESGVIVFPNPVPPGYTGTIAIRGVPPNSIVKITEPAGRLVFQVRAHGNQAVWDGKDYRGRRISTGVYFVFATDSQGIEKKVGRIAVAR